LRSDFRALNGLRCFSDRHLQGSISSFYCLYAAQKKASTSIRFWHEEKCRPITLQAKGNRLHVKKIRSRDWRAISRRKKLDSHVSPCVRSCGLERAKAKTGSRREIAIRLGDNSSGQEGSAEEALRARPSVLRVKGGKRPFLEPGSIGGRTTSYPLKIRGKKAKNRV